jgi:hypothetical protein
MPPAITISNQEQVALTATFVNAAGKPAKINGNPSWSVDDPKLGGFVAGDTPLNAIFRPADDAEGVATVTVTADADVHGGAPEPVTAQLTIGITAPEATAATLTPSAPTAKPAPAAATPAAAAAATAAATAAAAAS